jgi:hypothetical protein
MATLWIEFQCPEHGFERFKVKVVKKYNVNPRVIIPKFRTRPKYELSKVIVGRNVRNTDVKDYLVQYYKETGAIERILSIKIQS